MHLADLTKTLQSKAENKVAAKKLAAKDRWKKIKQAHPDQSSFVELVNELTGRPKAIKITLNNQIIYGAGEFSEAKNMTIKLTGDYSWMDKPRQSKFYAKKAHYEPKD